MPDPSPLLATPIGSHFLSVSDPPVRQESHSPAGSDPPGDNDAMGDVDNWGLKTGILGASSSANFMRSIHKVVDGTKTPDNGRVNSTGIAWDRLINGRLYQRQRRNSHSPEYVLPPRKTADRLVDIHWKFSQSIFPWLDRIRFMKWYDALWTGHEDQDFHVDDQVFYCILNIVFAISYKLDPSVGPEEQDALSSAHFLRAQKLLSFNLLELVNLEMVQALLLMGQYLQSTNMPRQCYQCIGMAIWISQDMGLHRPEALLSIRNQHEGEMARRAWHGCILMDRVISMTFGRPTRISHQTAMQSPSPSAIDDEFLERSGSGQGKQPADQPSKLHFFVAYCELHIILGNILSTFYAARTTSGLNTPLEQAHSNTTAGKQNVDKLLQFEKALNQSRTLRPNRNRFSRSDRKFGL